MPRSAQRAQEVEAFGTTFNVMHPLDCLRSRIANLELLPGKRNASGLAQARLAIEIVKRFIDERLREGNERYALNLANAVADLAHSRQAVQVGAQFDICIVDAIPADAMPAAYKEKQWPRVVERVERKLKAAKKSKSSA